MLALLSYSGTKAGLLFMAYVLTSPLGIFAAYWAIKDCLVKAPHLYMHLLFFFYQALWNCLNTPILPDHNLIPVPNANLIINYNFPL
jgi:hypothetical protein